MADKYKRAQNMFESMHLDFAFFPMRAITQTL
jgi:hypothetical protein